MFVVARITLLAFLFFVTNQQDNGDVQGSILEGIKRTTNAMNRIYSYANVNTRGFNQTLYSYEEFLDFGQIFIFRLKDFAVSFNMLIDQVMI